MNKIDLKPLSSKITATAGKKVTKKKEYDITKATWLVTLAS